MSPVEPKPPNVLAIAEQITVIMSSVKTFFITTSSRRSIRTASSESSTPSKRSIERTLLSTSEVRTPGTALAIT